MFAVLPQQKLQNIAFALRPEALTLLLFAFIYFKFSNNIPFSCTFGLITLEIMLLVVLRLKEFTPNKILVVLVSFFLGLVVPLNIIHVKFFFCTNTILDELEYGPILDIALNSKASEFSVRLIVIMEITI